MQPALVTTIIPVYNRAGMLRVAVESVLAQTYRPIEIVIVDDGSTDDTAAAADALAAAHPEIRVVHQGNTGVGLAREAGRRVARGEFIQHLDSDDVLYPRKFELQVAGLVSRPECGVSYGWTRAQNPDGSYEPAPTKRTGERIETMFPSMLASRWWHTLTGLYRASLLEAAGPWLGMRNEEDWEYDARIASLGVRLHYVPEWLSEYRLHGTGQLSANGLRPDVLRDRTRAHTLILRHAQRVGIGPDVPEMQFFARELFLLARQCGAAGLPDESRTLFELSREAAGDARDRLQYRVYARIARLIGWTGAGRLAVLSDRLRW
jgi:glycosyltransferase involved in cell wall biosynthesis